MKELFEQLDSKEQAESAIAEQLQLLQHKHLA